MRIGMLAFLLVVLALPALAQPELSLQEALARARQQNPELAAAELGPKVAEGELVQASAGVNPQVELEGSLDSDGVLESYGLWFSQEFELGGKRSARMAVAGTRVEEARLRQADAWRRLQQEVEEAFVELLYAQNLVQIRSQAVELSRRTLELSRKRLELGDVAGLDVIQLEAELGRREAALAEAEGRRQAAVALLAVRLGEPGTDLKASGELGAEGSVPELARLQDLARARPDLLATRTQAVSEKQGIDLAEAGGVPNLTAALGVGRERQFIGGDSIEPPGQIRSIDDSAWVFGLRLSMPIPINDTNEGNILKARALAEQAALQSTAAEQRVQAEVAVAYYQLLAARRARAPLRERALQASRKAMELAGQAYELGARDLLDVLQARQIFVEAHLDELEAARQESLALFRLEAAVGSDFPQEVP